MKTLQPILYGLSLCLITGISSYAQPVLTVTPEVWVVESAADSVTFEITNTGTGGLNWTITETCEWLDTDVTEGTNDGPFTAIFTENEGEERICTITVESNNATGSPFPVQVQQAAPVLQDSVELSLAANWNMVGLPVDVDNADYLALFPSATPDALWSYSNGYFQPNPPVLTPGQGYWLSFDQDTSATIVGTTLDSLSLSLLEGWNMIAGPNCQAALAEADDPDAIVVDGTLWGFEGGYVQPSPAILDPGEGYWLLTQSAGSVTLTCPDTASISASTVTTGNKSGLTAALNRASSSTDAALADLGKLIFRDATGSSRALFFGKSLPSGIDPASLSMPPAPHPDVFDVRFKNHNRFSDQFEAEIALQSSVSSIEVIVEALPDNGSAIYQLKSVSGEGDIVTTRDMREGHSFTLDLHQVQGLLLSTESAAGSIPSAFTLDDNYPNPFSTTTMIPFGVPEPSTVRIAVYDLLGRNVAILVDNETKEAGLHQVAFDASAVSSGLYFYKIETPTYRAVKSLTVLR